MSSKYNGHYKKRQICACLGWTLYEYEVKIFDLYKNNNSANDICIIINQKMPPSASISPRSIQRIVKKYALNTGQTQHLRTNAEGFRLKVNAGQVNWAYKRLQDKARPNNIGKAKRYKILARDGFKCVLCGATAKDDMLEVDHIIAITDGGNDNDDNLRCLCNQCNIGKRIINKEC